jgi:hypothetical protein
MFSIAFLDFRIYTSLKFGEETISNVFNVKIIDDILRGYENVLTGK